MIEGIVEVVSARGKAFNAKIDGTWYGCGFDKPAFVEGNKIKFGTTQNGKYTNLDQNTVEILEEDAAPALKRDAAGINGVDMRTILHASRSSAIEYANYLVANGGVKLPAKEADKFKALDELVTKLTLQFYQQGTAIMKGEWPFESEAGSTPEE